MKRSLALLCALTLIFLLTACKTEMTETERLGGIHSSSGDVYPEEFLHFDGKAISFNEFRYYYLNYKNMYLEEDAAYFEREGAKEALKEEILQCLRDSFAVRMLAKEYKVSLSKEEKQAVQEDIDQTIEFYGGKDNFVKLLHESYMSFYLYQTMMEYSSLYLKLFNTLFKDGGEKAWSDEEFYRYYQEHYVAVQEVFLPFEENENRESCPNTKESAQQIYQKALNGEDFWSLVEKYGKDEKMLDHPDGYYFTKGEAEEALYQASAALEIGQVGQPVITDSGIYIIKRMEMREVRMRENRETALFGYRDTLDQWHAGAYDQVFFQLYRERAETIQVQFGDLWNEISTDTVY